jgi:hypothetical protein
MPARRMILSPDVANNARKNGQELGRPQRQSLGRPKKRPISDRCGGLEARLKSGGRAKQSLVTVVSNLETQEPLWFGVERKKKTLVDCQCRNPIGLPGLQFAERSERAA